MARPEKPVTGDGPVAGLARALREARSRAGGLTYREMAQSVNFVASVLAGAAAGQRCPSWQITAAYVKACGEDPSALRPLWEEAWNTTHRRSGRPAGSRRRAASLPSRNRPTSVTQVPRQVTSPPDPWLARTPGQYVRQLRALRAWAGKPSLKDIARAGSELGVYRIASSSLYDALSPNRTTPPPLGITQAVVRACHADVETWTAAWQDIAMREFDAANLPPPEEDGSRPPGPASDRNIRLVS